jgi:uncharacterized membrane protein YkvI
MKNIASILSLLLLAFALNGCAAIGDIFKAGVWVGALVVIAIIGLVVFLVTRGSNKN